MTAPLDRHPTNVYAPAAVVLIALGLAVLAGAGLLLLMGVVRYDTSDLCDADDHLTLDTCQLDVEANQRNRQLIFTLGLAQGFTGVVLVGGGALTPLLGRRVG